jgi:hypothetical protein
VAISLARYWVRIHPDFTVFRAEVRAEAARMAATTDFKVRPSLDLTSFRAQWRVFAATYLKDQTITIRPVLAPGGLSSSAFRARDLAIKVRLDLTAFRAQWRIFAAAYLNVIHRIHVHPVISPTAVSGLIDAFGDAGGSSGMRFGRSFRLKMIAALVVGLLPALGPLLSIIGSIVQASGALFAALPLAISTVAVSVTALVLVFHNLADAIEGAFSGTPTKKQQEAYDKLSASAKAFVQVLLDTRTKLVGFQTEVQEAFFKPFLAGFKQLVASPAIAQLRKEMTLIAGIAGVTGAAIAKVFADSANSGQLPKLLTAVRSIFEGIAGVVPALVKMFLTLAVAAQPFAQALNAMILSGLFKLTDLVDRAAKDGRLAKFFDDGLNALILLMEVLGNLGEIFKTVFDALTGGSQDALGGLAAITQQFADFLNSVEGQKALGILADDLEVIGEIITQVLLPLLGPALDVLVAVFDPIREGILRILPGLNNFIRALVDGLTPILETLAPVFDRLVSVVVTFAVLALREMTNHIDALMPFLQEFIAKLGPQLIPAIESFGEALLALLPLIPMFTQLILAWAPLIIALIPVFGAWIRINGFLMEALAFLIGVMINVIGFFVTFGTAATKLGTVMKIVADFFVMIWNAVVSWFQTKIAPSFMKALADIGGFFGGLGRTVQDISNNIRGVLFAAWMFLYTNVFTPLSNMITQTLPNAFRTGVAAIGTAWERIKDLARAPVKFVIDVVVNPLISAFNKVSGFFGGPTLPNVPAIGDGPGLPRGRGFGDGPGQPGTGDGLGLSDILSLAKGPGEWLAGKVGVGQIVRRFGNSGFTQVLTGLGKKLLESAVGKIKSLISAGVGLLGGGGDSGVGLAAGISAVLANLRAVFGNVPLISGRRPGDRTLSGSISYHSSGRAIDIAPVLAWAQFIRAVYGSQLRELITPWNSLNVHNGRPHTYTGAVWNQHNFAGGNAHIHAAMANGGIINEAVFGVGRSGRTYSFGERGAEHVTPGATMERLCAVMAGVRDDLADLRRAVERVAPGVGRELNGAAAGTLQLGRTR